MVGTFSQLILPIDPASALGKCLCPTGHMVEELQGVVGA